MRRAGRVQSHFCGTSALAILKNLGWRFCTMAKLVYGMNQSLVDVRSRLIARLARRIAPGRQVRFGSRPGIPACAPIFPRSAKNYPRRFFLPFDSDPWKFTEAPISACAPADEMRPKFWWLFAWAHRPIGSRARCERPRPGHGPVRESFRDGRAVRLVSLSPLLMGALEGRCLR